MDKGVEWELSIIGLEYLTVEEKQTALKQIMCDIEKDKLSGEFFVTQESDYENI